MPSKSDSSPDSGELTYEAEVEEVTGPGLRPRMHAHCPHHTNNTVSIARLKERVRTLESDMSDTGKELKEFRKEQAAHALREQERWDKVQPVLARTGLLYPALTGIIGIAAAALGAWLTAKGG